MDKWLEAFQRLPDVMDNLRAQCPWDKKQTVQNLRHLTIEKTYKLGDIIPDSDLQEAKKKLGDLSLHIVFYAKVGSETDGFDIADVTNGVCEKLIVYHPHIYGGVKADSEEDVKRNQEKIGLKEGNKSVLRGVPKSLPTLVRASHIQGKVAGVGFDWDNIDDVFAKVKEEIEEFHAEIKAQKHTAIGAEFGDVLFSLINYVYFLKVDPEDVLERINKRFTVRFQYLERKAAESGKSLCDMTLAEMEAYWQEAKRVSEQ